MCELLIFFIKMMVISAMNMIHGPVGRTFLPICINQSWSDILLEAAGNNETIILLY